MWTSCVKSVESYRLTDRRQNINHTTLRVVSNSEFRRTHLSQSKAVILAQDQSSLTVYVIVVTACCCCFCDCCYLWNLALLYATVLINLLTYNWWWRRRWRCLRVMFRSMLPCKVWRMQWLSLTSVWLLKPANMSSCVCTFLFSSSYN